MKQEYRICTRCVMDTSDPVIKFDEQGYCSNCHAASQRLERDYLPNAEGQKKLAAMVSQIKKDGRKKEYDCVIGISGGVDSSYVAYWAAKNNLRPLAVHFDNGWNSEMAVQNIESLLMKLGEDLYTHVVDWEEFKDIQKSFLKSSLANLELPTDHAITALLYATASKHKIKYILSGSNLASECIMPVAWMEYAYDLRLLKSVHKKFGKKKMRTFPTFGILSFLYFTFVRRIKYITPLNYFDYDKEEAMSELAREVGWRKYESKHFESIYTRFFQGYFLIRKFGIDKRRAHFSSLIMSGQMTRTAALKELNRNDYYADKAIEDLEYVAKKFDMSVDEFVAAIDQTAKKSTDYPSYSKLFAIARPFIGRVKQFVTLRG